MKKMKKIKKKSFKTKKYSLDDFFSDRESMYKHSFEILEEFGINNSLPFIPSEELKKILKKCTFSIRKYSDDQIRFTLNEKEIEKFKTYKNTYTFTYDELLNYHSDVRVGLYDIGDLILSLDSTREFSSSDELENILLHSSVKLIFSQEKFYYDKTLLVHLRVSKTNIHYVYNGSNETINSQSITRIIENTIAPTPRILEHRRSLLERESRECYYKEFEYERMWKKYCEPKEQLISILLSHLQNATIKKEEQVTRPEFETIDKTHKIKNEKSVNARDDKLHRMFKKNVNMIMNKCLITGMKERVEYAHIKPYSISKKEEKYNECVDGFNGLILYNPIHQLFDDGMITFKNDGSLLISSELSKEELALYPYLQSGKKYTLGFLDEREVYLNYHRENIFKN